MNRKAAWEDNDDPETLEFIWYLQKQIEAMKRRGLRSGEDIKPLLLRLRKQHYRLTGMEGG